MSDSKKTASRSEAPAFVEDDRAETWMTYGHPETREPFFFVGLVWTCFAAVMVTYLALYYFPSLSEWMAW
jgi:hypothetical protein